MTQVQDAVLIAKTIIEGLTPAAPGLPLTAVYIYPDEYDTMPKKPAVTFATIGRLRANAADIWQQEEVCTYMHYWLLRIMIFLSVGETKDPSKIMANSMLLESDWEHIVIEALANDRTLTGTAVAIGESTGDGWSIASPDLEWRQWNQQPYWAMTFDVPVMQEHTF